MKYILTVTMFLAFQTASASLTDALSAAIQTSDKEKVEMKVALSVSEDYIEKATFKRGQKTQIIKEESSVIGGEASPVFALNKATTPEETPAEPETQESLAKELGDSKL